MAKSGAQPGNNNAGKNKIWSDALRKAVLARKKIDKLAEALIRRAEDGDVPALKELGDRLEGKVPQGIEGTGENGEFKFSLNVNYVDADNGKPKSAG